MFKVIPPNGLLLASVCCNMHGFENWFQHCSSSALNSPRPVPSTDHPGHDKRLICMPALVECYWLTSVCVFFFFFRSMCEWGTVVAVCRSVEAVLGWCFMRGGDEWWHETWADLTVHTCALLQKTPMKIVEEEEEEVAEIQPDPLHQLILHFSHNALTERRWESGMWVCVKPSFHRDEEPLEEFTEFPVQQESPPFALFFELPLFKSEICQRCPKNNLKKQINEFWCDHYTFFSSVFIYSDLIDPVLPEIVCFLKTIEICLGFFSSELPDTFQHKVKPLNSATISKQSPAINLEYIYNDSQKKACVTWTHNDIIHLNLSHL